MLAICNTIDEGVRRLAAAAAFMIVLIALIQIIVSILRTCYSVAPLLLQELIPNLNVVLVSIGICYAVLRDAHTRVDILVADLQESRKVRVELVLVLCLLWPVAFFLGIAFFNYAAQSWWSLEGSRNVGGFGGIYIVKSFLVLMSALLVVQAGSIVTRIVVRRRWPHPESTPLEA